VRIRADSGGGTHDFLAWLSPPGRRLHSSVGMTVTEDVAEAILALPDRVGEPAYDAGGQVRPGAWWPSSPVCWTCPSGRRGRVIARHRRHLG